MNGMRIWRFCVVRNYDGGWRLRCCECRKYNLCDLCIELRFISKFLCNNIFKDEEILNHLK